jgi:hypothetical protein
MDHQSSIFDKETDLLSNLYSVWEICDENVWKQVLPEFIPEIVRVFQKNKGSLETVDQLAFKVLSPKQININTVSGMDIAFIKYLIATR